MALLRHEIWRDPEGLTGMCFAGPMGDGFRALSKPGTQLFTTLDAVTRFEAMTKYYELMGWGVYDSDFDGDTYQYPDDWLVTQQS